MLKQSFSHISGIGAKTETDLWSNNINDWDTFNSAKDLKLSDSKIKHIKNALHESGKSIRENNPNYFSNGLQTNQHWRLFREFKNSTAYVDIETTGLYPGYDKITTIALYDGKQIKHYVNGKNLDDFKNDILDYKLLVTYNGKCFDIPFLEEFFNIKMNHSHIDLRYLLHSLGYSGGLKGCEKQLGISRDELEGIDGFFAIYLWEDYKENKNKKALDTLLAYNIEDVVNLENLMHQAYNLKLKDTPFEKELRLNMPDRPIIPFEPDQQTINKIRNRQVSAFSYELDFGFESESENESTLWGWFKKNFL